jgi:Tfp pilus assembly protein PilZ
VTVWCDEDDGEREIFLTHTENLGIGGACIICHRRFRLFSPVEMEIDLMDMEDHIRCKGKIVWLVQRKDPDARKPKSFDIGVEFQDLKEEDRKRVSKIVQRLGKYPDNLVP